MDPTPLDQKGASSSSRRSHHYYRTNNKDMSASWSIPDWLAARQDVGLHRHAALRARHGRITPKRLGSIAAWNPARIRNMILAVGPGTPASVLWQSGVDRNDHEENEMSEEDPDGLDDDDDDDDSLSIRSEGEERRLRGVVITERDATADDNHQGQAEEDCDDSGNDDNMNDDDNNDNNAGQPLDDDHRDRVFQVEDLPEQAQAIIREVMLAQMDDDDSDQSSQDGDEPDDTHATGWTRSKQQHPSLRHGGCINTACWLDCPWQLSCTAANGSLSSSSSPRAVSSRECPTQLITSGDDRLVKIWDVKDAMGMSSPLEGGWDTFCPLANMPKPDSTTLHKSWKRYYRKRPSSSRMAGSVVHLATLVSGHRGNVFHATPVADQPGKILTCGADGGLRLSDLQSEISSVVASVGDRSHFLFNPTMAFSHVFLTSNTGLLCSEEGLHRFDLRLSPREQERQSLLRGLDGRESSDPTDYCKTCAVWSPHVQNSNNKGDVSFVESNYVFVGRRSERVGLLDLRMSGGTSRTVQSYRPRGLKETRNVSVSGLDISKDGRELLVSYESDQIYTFPILHTCSSRAGPTLEEIDSFAKSADETVNELALYGGHLNRFTFLKNALYAGPNDDYICTGSDSGCGWIYERKTGAVVSLLGADRCTCNGVIPHPSLPFFISYGIDSTAKLWRATPPVSLAADDSPKGRAKCALEREYERSPLLGGWNAVQRLVERDVSPGLMPDFVARPHELAASDRFLPRENRTICGDSSPNFGNALQLLPSILRRNRHQCYRFSGKSGDSSHGGRGGDIPVEQSPEEFSHRVSLSQLHLQADRHGLLWSPCKPWALSTVPQWSQPAALPRTTTVVHHRAELVPDNPSDWLLYDPCMTGVVYDQMNFNLQEFRDILAERYAGQKNWLVPLHGNEQNDDDSVLKQQACELPPWLQGYDFADDKVVLSNHWLYQLSESTVAEQEFVQRSRRIFYTTIVLLKEQGNQAMKEGLFFAAARRYDKAIQYCAVALMKHEHCRGMLKHLACPNPTAATRNKNKETATINGSASIVVWTPLLQTLVTARLNMALLFLRPELAEPSRAVNEAKAALEFLRPFTGSGDGKKGGDPAIWSLQAKAHYRLGTAKLDLGNYSEAVECFEASLQDSKYSSRKSNGSKPDALVVKRLQEAKRKLQKKRKRDKKRYERAFRRLGTNET